MGKYWEESLVAFVSSDLEASGFHWNPAYNQFRRETGWGFQAIVLSFSHYERSALVEFFYGFRINALENLVQSFLNGNLINSADNLSLVVSTAKLMETPFDRIEIKDEADAILAGRDLLERNEKVGFPFFEAYNSIGAIEQLFNRTAEQAHPYFLNPANRAIRGIALAHLSGQKFLNDLLLRHQVQMNERFALPIQKKRLEQLAQFLSVL